MKMFILLTQALDLATTIVGVKYFLLHELNPLWHVSPWLFITVKLFGTAGLVWLDKRGKLGRATALMMSVYIAGLGVTNLIWIAAVNAILHII